MGESTGDSFKIIGLGEILWDVFPFGPKLGGAPLNFACHAVSVGKALAAASETPDSRAAMVSCVGSDEFGDQALAEIQERDVATGGVQRSADKPTGRVDVTLDDQGKASYTFLDDAAWDHIQWSAELQETAETCDAVCFGSLGQRSAVSRETIRQFVTATPENALRILDVNLRPPFYNNDIVLNSIELANVVKLNEEELAELAGLLGTSGSEIDQLKQLTEKYELRAVALTRGEQGAMLVRDDEVSQLPSGPTDVVDTVGAGDSFTATLVNGLLRRMDLDTINRNAIRVASYVCGQAGATPPLPDDFFETTN